MKHKLPRILISFYRYWPKTCQKIETPTTKFADYLTKCDTIQPDNPVSINELKVAFFPFR